MFGWKLVKEEKVKAQAVDQDGNPVEADVVDEKGKPVKTTKTVLKTIGKVAAGVAAVAAAGFTGYTVGGKKVGKVKDEEIRKLQNDKWELSQELEEAYAKAEPETEETSDEEDIEVTNF